MDLLSPSPSPSHTFPYSFSHRTWRASFGSFWDWREEETKQTDREWLLRPDHECLHRFGWGCRLEKRFGSISWKLNSAPPLFEKTAYFPCACYQDNKTLHTTLCGPLILHLTSKGLMHGRSERQWSDVSHRPTERQTLEDEKAVCPAVFNMSVG